MDNMNELNMLLTNIQQPGNWDVFKTTLSTCNIDELPALYIFGVLEHLQNQVGSESQVQELFDLLLLMSNKVGFITPTP